MNMGHWWNDTDSGKPKYVKKNCSGHPKFHKTGLCHDRPATKPVTHSKYLNCSQLEEKIFMHCPSHQQSINVF